MGTTHTGADEISLVRTPALKDIEAALAFALPRHAIVVVHGEHGTGKRTAIDTVLAAQGISVTTLDLPPCQSSKDIVRWLHTVVVSKDEFSERALQDDLVAALAEEDRIVLVRDADRLSKEAAGQLEWLHARPGGRWTLILHGGPKTGSAIARDPLLRGAVSSTVEVKALKGDALLKALRAMHPLLVGADTSLLHEIDHRVCHGLMLHWRLFLDHAIALRNQVVATGGDAPVLDRKFAKAVVHRMPTTTHRAR